MKGWRPPYATSRPFMPPAAMPTRRATGIARKIGPPRDISTATVTAAIAAVGPTDRSMPPAMMTSVMPSATQALIEDCCRTLRRLVLVRKFGLRTAKTTTIATRPNSVPASRSPTLRPNRRRLGAAVAAVLSVLDMAQDLGTDGDVGGGDDCGTASATIASSLRPPR